MRFNFFYYTRFFSVGTTGFVMFSCSFREYKRIGKSYHFFNSEFFEYGVVKEKYKGFFINVDIIFRFGIYTSSIPSSLYFVNSIAKLLFYFRARTLESLFYNLFGFYTRLVARKELLFQYLLVLFCGKISYTCENLFSISSFDYLSSSFFTNFMRNSGYLDLQNFNKYLLNRLTGKVVENNKVINYENRLTSKERMRDFRKRLFESSCTVYTNFTKSIIYKELELPRYHSMYIRTLNMYNKVAGVRCDLSLHVSIFVSLYFS